MFKSKITTQGYCKAILSSILLLSLTACSTYPNKFKCGDAKGLGCTMLSEIDRQIDSGEIERAYQEKQDKKCRGKKCNTRVTTESLQSSHRDQGIYQQEASDDHKLYF